MNRLHLLIFSTLFILSKTIGAQYYNQWAISSTGYSFEFNTIKPTLAKNLFKQSGYKGMNNMFTWNTIGSNDSGRINCLISGGYLYNPLFSSSACDSMLSGQYNNSNSVILQFRDPYKLCYINIEKVSGNCDSCISAVHYRYMNYDTTMCPNFEWPAKIAASDKNWSTNLKKKSSYCITPLKISDNLYHLLNFTDSGINIYKADPNSVSFLYCLKDSNLSLLNPYINHTNCRMNSLQNQAVYIFNGDSANDGRSRSKVYAINLEEKASKIKNIKNLMSKFKSYNLPNEYLAACHSSNDSEIYVSEEPFLASIDVASAKIDTLLYVFDKNTLRLKEVIGSNQVLYKHGKHNLYMSGITDMKLASNGSVYLLSYYRMYKKRNQGGTPYDSSFVTISEIRIYKGKNRHINWNFIGETFHSRDLSGSSQNSGAYAAFSHTPNNFHKLNLKYFDNNCGPYIPIVIEHDTCYQKNYIYLPEGDSILADSFAYSPKRSGSYFIKLKCITATGFYTWYWDSIDFFKPVKSKFSVLSKAGCRYIDFNFIDSCQSDTVNEAGGRTWHWNFGDGSDTTINIPAGIAGNGSIAHKYTKTGKFQVTLNYSNGFCSSQYIYPATVEILDAPMPGIYATKSYCSPYALAINDTVSTAIEHRYNWGVGKDTIIFSPQIIRHYYPYAGTFLVKQTLKGFTGCITKDSMLLELDSMVKLDLGPDTFKCPDELYILKAPAGYKYIWNTTDTSEAIYIQQPGIYGLKLFNGLCSVSDSIAITTLDNFCGLTMNTSPNPGGAEIMLNGYSRKESDLQLQLIDATGRQLYSYPIKVNGTFSIPVFVSNYTVGIYILRIQNNNNHFAFKVIKVE